MDTGNFTMLFSQKEIEVKVKEIGNVISQDYIGKTPVLIGILKGSFVFLADLVRNIEGIDMELDFIGISSYEMATSPLSQPIITKDLGIDIEGRDVLIIEDIVDTGGTLEFLIRHIKGKKPSSLKICSLIDKRGRRKKDHPIDYIGFEIEHGFVVGYGLDFGEKYRNMKDILLLDEGG